MSSFLSVGSCALDFTANPSRLAELLPEPDKPPIARPQPVDKANVISLSAGGPLREVILINLACYELDKEHSNFAIPITSLRETLDNLDKEKVPHMALVFPRETTMVIDGQPQTVLLADMIPIQILLHLKHMVDTSQSVPSTHPLLQFFALTMPYELLLYLAYQSSMPQLDNPGIYARNWAVIQNYVSKAGIKKELSPPEDITQQLRAEGVSDEDITVLLTFIPMVNEVSSSPQELAMMFISPDCRYSLAISLVLPPYSELMKRSDIQKHTLADILSSISRQAYFKKGESSLCP